MKITSRKQKFLSKNFIFNKQIDVGEGVSGPLSTKKLPKLVLPKFFQRTKISNQNDELLEKIEEMFDTLKDLLLFVRNLTEKFSKRNLSEPEARCSDSASCSADQSGNTN